MLLPKPKFDPFPNWLAILHFGQEVWPRSDVLEMVRVYATLACHFATWTLAG